MFTGSKYLLPNVLRRRVQNESVVDRASKRNRLLKLGTKLVFMFSQLSSRFPPQEEYTQDGNTLRYHLVLKPRCNNQTHQCQITPCVSQLQLARPLLLSRLPLYSPPRLLLLTCALP